MNAKSLKSNLILLLAACIWGLAFVAQSDGMKYIGPLTFTAIRCAIGAIVLIPVFFIINRNNLKKENRKAYKKTAKTSLIVGLLCGVVLFFALSSQQIGLKYTPAGKAGFITALYIVLVPVISTLFFKAKSTFSTWVSVIFATIGLYLLCVKEGFSISKGDIWVIICALVFSFHIIIVDKYSQKIDGVLVAVIQFIVVALIAFPVSAVFEKVVDFEMIKSAGVSILYTGIFSSGVAFTLQIYGQKNAKNPTLASLLMSMESVFAAVFGWLILHEKLQSTEYIGVVLMACAIILAQIKLPEKRNRTSEKGLDA